LERRPDFECGLAEDCAVVFLMVHFVNDYDSQSDHRSWRKGLM
jgi:hypothetical protein